MKYDDPELIDRLAGEYVLGTLRGPALRRFQRLLTERPAVHAAVGLWEARLHRLASPLPPLAPPGRVWSAIETRLGWRSARPSLGMRLLGWLRPVALLGCGVLLGVGLVRSGPEHFLSLDALALREEALPQSYVGLLSDAAGQPVVLASSPRQGRRLTLKVLRPLKIPPGQVLQLWALPQDGGGKPLPPVPIGLVPVDGKGSIELAGPAELLFAKVARLGVTAQDRPAQPGELPGVFLLSGHCVKLW